MRTETFSAEFGKIREDLRGANLASILAQPGYWAVINFRVAAALTKSRLLLPLYLCYALIWRIVSLITGIEISPKAEIGAGLRIVHFGQVFISAGTTIGQRCLLLNNVTIGTARFDDNSGPQIGDDVRVGVGARILGRITIGDRCEVGANALVTRSFPADSVILGAPGTSIGLRQTNGAD